MLGYGENQTSRMSSLHGRTNVDGHFISMARQMENVKCYGVADVSLCP